MIKNRGRVKNFTAMFSAMWMNWIGAVPIQIHKSYLTPGISSDRLKQLQLSLASDLYKLKPVKNVLTSPLLWFLPRATNMRAAGTPKASG